MARKTRWVLLIGVPGTVAERTARALLDAGVGVCLLVEKGAASRRAAALHKAFPKLVEVHQGCAHAIDFGLAGADYLALARKVAAVFHLAPGRPAPPPDAPLRDARELVEFCRAAPSPVRLVYLSGLGVAGRVDGVFAERDTGDREGGDGLVRAQQYMERVLGRFASELPIVVIRAGIVVGRGEDLFPVATMALAEPAAFQRWGGTRMRFTPLAPLARLCAQLVDGPVCGTLHYFCPQEWPAAAFVRKVESLAVDQVPASFHLGAAARRKLLERRFTVKEFFGHNDCTAKVSDQWTRNLLREHKLVCAGDDTCDWEPIVEAEVEAIAGFK